MAEASWRDTFAHFYKPEDLAAFLDESFGPEGRLIRDLANPAITWAIARLDGTIAGYAKMVPPTLEQAQPTDAQLSQLYVATDWHGRGVAHALMDWAMATAPRAPRTRAAADRVRGKPPRDRLLRQVRFRPCR
ncbi:GNAT family N-acetyltransferase [Sphingomonas sp. J344]|uniref:GNAT family N-acetyltransferase n=1 Tax=Sphingomonas sp. J344 TaxID=2898434 RepID=UPI002150786F|nr:GNAT family N-acetyltransferase [Sphingomonas sp. J344]MCR5869935.1 GNAT family N-acetyltransferase [Sphingomonas sp. J344]